MTEDQIASIQYAADWLSRSEDIGNRKHGERLRALLSASIADTAGAIDVEGAIKAAMGSKYSAERAKPAGLNWLSPSSADRADLEADGVKSIQEPVAWTNQQEMEYVRKGGGGIGDMWKQRDYEDDKPIALYSRPVVVSDKQLDELVENSDGFWVDDEFRINCKDLMTLLRVASGVEILAPPAPSVADAKCMCSGLGPCEKLSNCRKAPSVADTAGASEDAWPSAKDAAVKACALMIKGICMTQPQDQWAAQIEKRIRFMLKDPK